MRLRLVSLNVWALPWPVGHRVAERMARIGAELTRLAPDVAAFQEVWREDARAALIEAGRRTGLAHAWHNPSAPFGGGLLVLSRFAIASARFERFDLCGLPQRVLQADYYGRKGFALLALVTPAGEIRVVDTHLQAGYGKRRDDEYVGQRTAQVIQLAAGLRGVRRPLLVAGDFNFQDMYEEFAVLRGLSRLRDTAAELDRRQDTVLRPSPYRSDETASSSRIDYVYLRDGVNTLLKAVSVERVFDTLFEIDGDTGTYSDHCGLLVEVEIAPGSSPREGSDRAAIRLARELIEGARAAQPRRRRDERAAASFGIGLGGLGIVAGRHPFVSRRNLLRAGWFAGSGLAFAPAAGFLALAESFAPDELHAYGATLRRLDEFERRGR